MGKLRQLAISLQSNRLEVHIGIDRDEIWFTEMVIMVNQIRKRRIKTEFVLSITNFRDKNCRFLPRFSWDKHLLVLVDNNWYITEH